MLLPVVFGGIAPKIQDPKLLPDGRGQTATNCRFDRGGVSPLFTDLQTAVPAKPGTKKSIFLYQNQYWFHWIDDVDCVPSPTPNDAYNRVYFTEGGVLKVTDSTIALAGGTLYPNNAYLPTPPVPDLALAVVATGSITDDDPTLKETRFYVYTLVNAYGDEGPPSPVSNKEVWSPGQEMTIATSYTPPAGAYNLFSVRVYRLNEDASSNEQMQLVYETSIDNLAALPNDDVDSEDLDEVLESAEYDAAPAGLKGLVTVPGKVLAGYVGNRVCVTFPGRPHAWPVRLQQVTEWPIVGLGVYGTSIVVTTEGLPYIITGTDPENYVMERMEVGLSNVSKRSTVDMGAITAYASNEGLVIAGPSGTAIVTADIMDPADWRAYVPSSINGYLWEGKYVGFYDTGVVQGGFIFDPATKDLSPLDFYATAGYRDPKTGKLYLQVGNNIVAFNSGATARSLDAKSKRYTFSKCRPSIVKVIALSYPVTIQMYYPRTGQTISESITSEEPQKVTPPESLVNSVDVRVYGQKGLTAMYLADNLGEIPL